MPKGQRGPQKAPSQKRPPSHDAPLRANMFTPGVMSVLPVQSMDFVRSFPYNMLLCLACLIAPNTDLLLFELCGGLWIRFRGYFAPCSESMRNFLERGPILAEIAPRPPAHGFPRSLASACARACVRARVHV